MKQFGFSFLAVLLITGFSLSSFSIDQENSILSTEDVLNKIHENIKSAPEMNRWQASVLTTLYDMDKNWEPKKKTVIEKQIVVDNKTRIEKVFKATEYKDDEIKDVTNEFKEEAAKMNAKNRSSDGEESGGRHRGMNLGMEDIFPFGEAKRKDYDFSLHKETLPDGREVYILKTVSKQESSEYFEGTYTIDADTLSILRAELIPAKNPGPLKLLEMDMEFEHLLEGYLIIKKASVRVHVGLIIKNIRMQTEEVYTDYDIFN